jgi:hypothetical protein
MIVFERLVVNPKAVIRFLAPILMTSQKSERRFSIYVIRLRPDVLGKKRFREANPNHDSSKRCVYVGMTACSPKERFEQHKAGYKCCTLVRDFGVCLMPRQFAQHNPMTYDNARRMEVEKARRLRKRGYAVWQK